MRFQDLPNTKKGDMGEALVDDYLVRQRVVPFLPTTDGRHAFDRICLSIKRGLFLADVKTKPCRLYYPDTGIDEACYREYRAASKLFSVPFFLFFVCEQHEMIHGNWLNALDEPRKVQHGPASLEYPAVEATEHGEIRYWPTKALYALERIEGPRLVRLRDQTTRRYPYSWSIEEQPLQDGLLDDPDYEEIQRLAKGGWLA